MSYFHKHVINIDILAFIDRLAFILFSDTKMAIRTMVIIYVQKQGMYTMNITK